MKVTEEEKLSNNSMELLIWDLKTTPICADQSVLLWSDKNDNFFSIMKFVEENSLSLRAKYVSWIFKLGEINLGKKSLIKNLQIRENFSFWWMTLFAEKSNTGKSLEINNVIKFLAFLDWEKDKNIASLDIVSLNPALVQCLKEFCRLNHIQFINRTKRNNLIQTIKSSKYVVFIYTCCAIAISFLKNLRFFKKDTGLWENSMADTTIISYFANIDEEELNEKRFKSSYWGSLSKVLNENGVNTNWLHLSIDGPYVKNRRKVESKLNELTSSSENKQAHRILESHLSFKIYVNAILDWFKIIKKYKLLTRSVRKNKFEDISLFPFFQKDCIGSIFGMNALENLLKLNLFEAILNELPKQKFGIYLQENQGWEAALNYVWLENGHDKLIAFAHSTIRFWDLRYFFDAKILNNLNIIDCPLPNIIACNGETAKNQLLEGGYNSENLFEVESLRYLNVINDMSDIKTGPQKDTQNINLLVLGDYSKIKTIFQLRLLEEAFINVQKKINIIFKPHPARPMNLAKFPKLSIQSAIQPMHILLNWADITFSSESTSAVVEAYMVGKEILIACNNKDLNLSPLKDFKNVYFVDNAKALAQHLNSFSVVNTIDEKRVELFYLDKGLPKWKKLLQIN